MPAKRLLAEGLDQVLAHYVGEGQMGAQAPSWVPEGQRAVRADGELFLVDATLSCTEANGQPLYTLILRDVEERQRAKAERQRLEGLNLYLQEELREPVPAADLVGNSPGLRQVMDKVQQVAVTDATARHRGDRHGKEVIARALHALSRRKAR